MKTLIHVLAIILLSIAFSTVSMFKTISGADIGGTKGLLSYSRVRDGELHYPTQFLQIGSISTLKKSNDIIACTAVNGLQTKAYGWPFYYAVDDPNCGSKNIFPLPFLFDMLFFITSLSLIYYLFVRLRKI